MKCWRDAAQVLILQSTPRFYLYHRPSVMSRYACWAAASFRWFVRCRVRGDGMLSHAYHLNQKHQIMITIQDDHDDHHHHHHFHPRPRTGEHQSTHHHQAFTVPTARDLGSLLLTRWHLQDIKVRDRGSDGAEKAISTLRRSASSEHLPGNLYIWV